MPHIDDVDLITRELANYKYSLNNPYFKDLAYINNHVITMHELVNTYLEAVRKRLYENKSILDIHIITYELKLNSKSSEIFKKLSKMNGDVISPFITSYLLFNYDISHSYFIFESEVDDNSITIKIRGLYSEIEIKRQGTFNSIDHLMNNM